MQLLFLLIILNGAFSQYTTIYEAFGPSQLGNEGWNIVNKQGSATQNITECQMKYIFGGNDLFNKDTIITSFFSLPSHSEIKIKLTLWKYNVWGTNDKINIFVDDQILYPGIPLLKDCLCEQNVEYIHYSINHNFNTATVFINTSISTNNGNWGISDFKFKVKMCPAGCLVCDVNDSIPQHCINWNLAYQSLTSLNVSTFFIEGWKISNYENGTPISQCQNIPVLCGYNHCGMNSKIQVSIKLPTHSQIKIQFKLFKIDNWNNNKATLKVDNQENWNQIYTPYQDYSICGDQYYEYVDNVELNQFHSREILTLELSSNLNDTPDKKSIGLRDVQVFIDKRACLSYDFDCCGDQIKQYSEDCDDGNTIPFDGCFNCQYSCIDGCLNCVNGFCLLCKDDWVYNDLDNTCNQQKQQIKSIPLYNNQQNPFPCNQECEICIDQICLKCSFRSQLIIGQCKSIECEDGFIFDNDYCPIICGDGKINSLYEECDDGNDIQYDGCYNCLFECKQNCSNSQKGKCIDQCQYGYQINNNQCLTICGDEIIEGLEECDDGNNDEFDGCNQCKYQCPLYCNECINGKCQECEVNFILVNNFCTNICGDGILTLPVEKCDDFNNQSGDGCSNKCLTESQWICQENQECTYQELSYFQVKYINQINEYQYVSLTFTQQMKRNSNTTQKFIDFIEFQFLGNQSFDFIINVISLQEASSTLNWIHYKAEIMINADLNYGPELEIQLKEPLYNSLNIPMANANQTIQLGIPKFMSEQQLQTSEKLKSSQQNLIYSLGGVGVVLIITGFGNIAWSNLDMFQEISYLRFINVNYPQNIMIFFQSIDIISLQSYTIDLHFSWNDYLKQETTGKYQFYEINASLVFNVQSIVFSFILLLIFYQFVKGLSIIFNYLNIEAKTFFASKLIHKISFRALKIRYYTLQYGLDEILQKSSWSILFMVFIQLNYFSFAQSVLGLAILFLYFVYIVKISLPFKDPQCHFDNKLNVIYYTKQISFMGVLIFFQSNQQIQVILLTLIYSCYLICFLILKKKDNKLEYYKKLILECSLCIFVGLSNCYFDDSLIYISYDQQVSIGWFTITLLIVIIFCYITCDSFKLIQVFIKCIRRYSALKKSNDQTSQQGQKQ